MHRKGGRERQLTPRAARVGRSRALDTEKLAMSASQLPTVRRSTRLRARPTSSKTATPELVLGRYRLQRRLGTGGFGTVWLAHDEHLDREVAIKVVPRERVVDGRLEREARAAARLLHPGVVTLYEATLDDESAYLVSELVRGATLDELLEAGRLSDRDVVGIAIALCDALGYAHSQGIVHRDVKPSNILVPEQPTSSAGVAKLTDFGVARVLGGDSLTRTGDVLGTAAYMAPEQAEGLPAGAPADLYALALVVYEALTGVNPVRTGTAAQRARRLGAHLPPLRRQRRDLPRSLGQAIDLALRPRPRERGTIDELKLALVAAHADLADTPGVVEGPFIKRTDQPMAEPFAPVAAVADEHAGADDFPLPVNRSARILGGVAGGAATAWITAHALSTVPLAPAAIGVLAAVLIAAIPRIAWLAMICGLGCAAAIDGRPGAAIMVLLAGLLPVPLLLFDGSAWPLPSAAPALGMIGLGGAWPALAGRARGPWRRAVLGGCGWVWLVLAAPLAGTGLYLAQISGIPAPGAWTGSVRETVDTVLRPTLTSGVLAAAPVWALGAMVLPWLVRGRSLHLDVVLVAVWAATVVSASTTAIALAAPGSVHLAQGTAVFGAILGAAIALAPGLIRAGRGTR